MGTNQRQGQGNLRRHAPPIATVETVGTKGVWGLCPQPGVSPLHPVLTNSSIAIAANAYQDVPGNFKVLASLVQEPGYPVYVNEYIHGYKDREAIAQEIAGNVFSYLANTPIALVAMQAAVILLVLIVAKNQRFGSPTKLEAPQIDNSEAYIQALGTVLNKAECSEFGRCWFGV